jgi:hypothetical protein
MSMQSIFEKLELKDEKNLLIQGLPSSIEKQFTKLSYSKSVTPLLKTKKIDFALVFAVNQNQLCNILKDVFNALHPNSKLWIAFPKSTSKITSDLNRDCSWNVLSDNGFEGAEPITLDHCWSATRFSKSEQFAVTTVVAEREKDFDKNLVKLPVELETVLEKHKSANDIFAAMPPSHQKEYVSWIEEAKRTDTKQRRAEAALEKILATKK